MGGPLNRPFLRALILSVIFHVLLVFSLLTGKAVQKEVQQEIKLVYNEKSTHLLTRVRTRGGKSNLMVNSRLRTIPLSSLAPKLHLTPPAREDWTRDTREEDFRQRLTWADSAAYEDGGPSAAQDLSAGQVDFIVSLWRMIDQYIEENPFLSEYAQTGRVFLRFDIDENGRLCSMQASAPNRVLKVIAARAVRKAVRNETGDVHFPAERMSVQARFSWSSYQSCQNLRGHRGRYLSFCHYAENKRKKFTGGERAATWAGAIYNNGPWAYEEIKKYNREESRRKSKFNPFEEYERDPDWNL